MQLMTSKQKATELGISRSTLTRWVAAGRIVPAFKAAEKNGITLFHPLALTSATPADVGASFVSTDTL